MIESTILLMTKLIGESRFELNQIDTDRAHTFIRYDILLRNFWFNKSLGANVQGRLITIALAMV